MPTLAAEKLYPGQDVGVDGTRNSPVGIVDPFLKSPVLPGERFWLIVYPRQINSLRHVWTHPAFVDEFGVPSESSKARSKEWLKNFCETNDCPDYESVMEAVSSTADSGGGDDNGWWKDGEYIGFRGRDAHASIPPEFWDHAEVVVGRRITDRAEYFTCSC